MINKLSMKSKDIISDNIDKISELFPNCISEGKINFEMLKQELSKDIIEDGKEKYQLTWVGKRESIVNANTPTEKTLRPVKEKSVDFDDTKNIYIEGDNLEVLKILQESYLGKIKCIYIDPPYNTGNDFIYNDKFINENEIEESGQIDEYNNKLISNVETNGKFHSDWLSMMYPRLKLSRNLLAKNGVCFISIDEHELQNLIKLVTEIYGDNNYDILVWRKNGKQGNTKVINRFKNSHEYIVVAYKNKNTTVLSKMKLKPNWNSTGNPDNDPRGNWMSGNISKDDEKSRSDSANYYTVTTPSGKQITREWFISKEEFEKLANDIVVTSDGKKVSRIHYPNGGDGIPRIKRFENEEQEFYFDTIIDEMGTFTDAHKDLIELFDGKDLFSTPKPVKIIEELIRVSTNKNDIVMDFFAGSSTTAHSVLRLNSEGGSNRRYILIQIPELCDEKSVAYKNGYKTICEIGEERIKRVTKKIKEEINADIDYGFRVYKVDSSNMKDVYYIPTELHQSQLNMFESNVKEDRTAEDLLIQVILDLGLTLDLSIEEKKILNNNVYFVESNSLVACFDDTIDINIIDEICKCKPLKIVFKESSFKTDSDKINTFEKIKKLSSETEVNVI
jgi:site-specific DNA-methyltransferase (adenine-specific)